MASIIPLIHEYVAHPPSPESRIIIIEGARTKSELLFEQEIKSVLKSKEKAFFCTDDGSYDFKGYVTDKISEILKLEIVQTKKQTYHQPVAIYACGPERMLVQVVAICEKNKISAQLSMERMMRCGFGICGLCALEPDGLLVCRDGPIFSINEIRNVSDFGKYHRDLTGKPYSI
jgi:dihydroorotate dehydrogenase electron transfer subunit